MKTLITWACPAAISNLGDATLIASLADGSVLGGVVTFGTARFLNLIRQRPRHAVTDCRACL
ncbi:MAG TPA: hypothetical protein VKQ29_14435 [Aliidongia sp.]|nr:hypothetical protein [Aliidongia sp.]